MTTSDRPIDPAPDTTAPLVDQIKKRLADGELSATMPMTVAWLPAEEYAEWPTRWPDMSNSYLVIDKQDDGSVDHAEYCRRMERRLREISAAGVARLSIAPLRSAEFDRWVADHGPDEPDPSQLRADYAADLGQQRHSRTIAWPPGRNEPCWCGSGRKYKKCCAAITPEGCRCTP